MTRFADSTTWFVLSKWFFRLGIALTILIHLPFLNRPPESMHVWRQCLTLGVARNLYTESMNLFQPRVDNRRGSQGITGSHFLSYEFALASIYHITGERFWVHRCFSLLLYLLGAWGMYHLLLLITKNEWIGRLSFWGFLWSPELFYHGINAMPDILALSASIWGLYYFLRYLFGIAQNKPPDYPSFLLGLLLITLGGLTKLQYLAVGFPIVGFLLIFFKDISLRRWIEMTVFGIVSVALPLMWYGYAIQLTASSGLPEFGLELRPVGSWSEGWTVLLQNLVSDLPETLMNYANFTLFLLGLFFCFRLKKWHSHVFLPYLILTIGLIAYHLIELSQMKAHAYYMMPYFLVLLPIAGYGGYQLWKRGQIWLLCTLIVLQPVFCCIRILPARWLNTEKWVPQELYIQESRQRLAESVPPGGQVIMGVDKSNCIYFYFLNKKGYGLSNSEELFKPYKGKSTLNRYWKEGVRYMFTDDASMLEHEELKRLTETVILKENNFYVIKLKEDIAND